MAKHRIDRRYAILFAAVAILFAVALYSPRARTPATQRGVAELHEPAAASEPRVAMSVARATPRPANGERHPELLAAQSIDAIADVIRDYIAGAPRYAKLATCEPAVDLACRELLSQAIYEAMHVKVLAQTKRGELGLKQLSKHDADAIFAAAGHVLTSSKDSIERASALMFLRSVPSLPGRALPEAVYRNLADRTVAEAQLTLQEPIGGPMPYPEVPRELVTLFTQDRDSRLQDTALSVLAHPETETELLAAVRETGRKHGPEWSGWLSSVGPAVAPCGMACLQTIEAVLDASGDAPEVAEEILRVFPEAERMALTEHMKSRFEPKALFALATSAGVELPATP